jgi:hypothetical protein
LQRSPVEEASVAEVLTRFSDPIRSADGRRYVAQACGAPNNDGLWDGWIEFVPNDGGAPVRSPRETTQPNRTDAEYWATGLTVVYLEGALARALTPPRGDTVPLPSHPIFDGPALPGPQPRATGDAVMDPFSVYDKGESMLRQRLGALSSWHLVNIISAYDLSDTPSAVLNTMPTAALVDLIVAKVREETLIR